MVLVDFFFLWQFKYLTCCFNHIRDSAAILGMWRAVLLLYKMERVAILQLNKQKNLEFYDKRIHQEPHIWCVH